MHDCTLIVVTRDRREILRQTLQGLTSWWPADSEILVYDDSASRRMLEGLASEFPQVQWFSGPTPIGPSRGRNVLLRHARGHFVICLDDDADILTPDACERLQSHFDAHPRCGIVTFRVWWCVGPPPSDHQMPSRHVAYECNDFLGGAHAMRAECFAAGGAFAEWMTNYGEEAYVAAGAALRGWQVHYLPSILVHHRARPIEERGSRAQVRWWLRHQLFNQLSIVAARFPGRVIPLRTAQLLAHYAWNYGVRKGLVRECLSAVTALIQHLPEIWSTRASLSPEQYRRWNALPPPVYYWSPDRD